MILLQARERFLRPTPEAIAWERKLDYLGDDLRRYAYSQVKKNSQFLMK